MAQLFKQGRISIKDNVIFWQITDFLSLPQESGSAIWSEEFYFDNCMWKMCIFPGGFNFYRSEGWFGISLRQIGETLESHSVLMTLCTRLRIHSIARPAPRYGIGLYAAPKMIPHSELCSKKEELFSDGALLISGKIEREEHPCGPSDILTELSGWESSIAQLLQDYKELLQSGKNTDVVLKVQGREFKVHRTVLAARSPVFSAMMTHEMKEKNTGVVDIEDSDPDSFPDFLRYLYTGSIEHLTWQNCCNLYVTADKYQVNNLKRVCLDHLSNEISVQNFCDIMKFVLKYSDKKLLDAAARFFVFNFADIAKGAEWEEFLTENESVVNSLYLNALQSLRQFVSPLWDEPSCKRQKL